MNATSENLRKLLSNGVRYSVPPYQRDYSWGAPEWEQLWEDVRALLAAPDSEHYMGAIVLQTQDRRAESFTIIDGQQRLVTLSLLILATVQVLHDLAEEGVDPEHNRARAQELYSRFIGDRDPASLRSDAKIRLNVENDDFYSRQLIRREALPRKSSLRRSNQQLLEAFLAFREKVRGAFPANNGEEIASFVNGRLATQLRFIRVEVDSEQDAYSVFETLNARGTQLTSADLLKNYLLQVIAKHSPSDANHAHAQWRRVTDCVESKNLPEFLRHYRNSVKVPYIRQERLFREIKETVKTREAAFDLLDRLETAAQWYRASSDADDELWNEYPDPKGAVRELILFGITQHRTLLLAAGRRFDRDELTAFLRDCVVVSFRFTIIGNRNPSDLEVAYNQLAGLIESGKIHTAKELRDGYRQKLIYPNDDEFREEFARCEIPTSRRKKLVKYILGRIERQIGGHATVEYDSANVTIEHILPDRGGDAWDAEFPPDKHERFSARLGNYTLLETGLNHELGNAAYPEKQAVYSRSQYKLTQSIDTEEWTPSSIERRQREMAKYATAIWRLTD